MRPRVSHHWRICLIVLLLVGCANPLHEATYQRYIKQGEAAEQSGNLPEAAEAFRRATLNSSWGHLGDDYGAYALWKYGRVLLWSGSLTKSEEVLKKALEVREKFEHENPRQRRDTAPILAALAELYLAANRLVDGIPYVERLADGVKNLGAEQRKTAIFALQEYSRRLRTLGFGVEAVRLEKHALQLER